MNGLVVAENEFEDIRIRHQGDIVGQVIDGAFTVVNEFERILDTRDKWSGLTLNHDEKVLFAEAAQSLRWEPKLNALTESEQVLFDAEKLLKIKRADDRKDDLWSTFNVVQENIIKGGTSYLTHDQRGHIRRASTRPVKAVGENLKLNSALWQLASKMAELKAA